MVDSTAAYTQHRNRDQDRLHLMRALFPDLAANTDAALARHCDVDAASRFDSWIDAQADELLPGAGFSGIVSAEASEVFARAFAVARTVGEQFSPALSIPEPEAFAEAGVDFSGLADALLRDPELLPVPAPYGLGADAWQRAFRAASSPGSQLVAPLDPAASPLVLATEAVQGFAQLDAVPAALVGKTVAGAGAQWSLRLVPAAQKPQTLGLGFAHGEHVSLPEMLMMQLMQLARGDELVDTASFTWLAGSLADGRLAARHVYDASENVVRITCREVGSQGPHMGSRPPLG